MNEKECPVLPSERCGRDGGVEKKKKTSRLHIGRSGGCPFSLNYGLPALQDELSRRFRQQRRREAGIVFLIQALAFFLFSARTNVSSISRRSKEPPGIVSLSLRFSIFFALQSIIMRRAVPMVLTNSFPCTETAPTRRRSPSSQFLS